MEDPDPTASSEAVRSGSALFVYATLGGSKHLKSEHVENYCL